MEEYVEKESALAETFNLTDLIGLRVLTKAGVVLGSVREVHTDPDKYAFSGIVVRRGPLKEPLYICRTYIAKITAKAVMLTIEPAVLLVGTKLISADGKKFGTVERVMRLGATNDIDTLIVRHGLFKKCTLPANEIKQLGTSILLKKDFDQLKQDYGTAKA